MVFLLFLDQLSSLSAMQWLQAIVGFALFFGAGYSLSRAFFKKADLIERVALSIAIALTVPALVLVALNLALGMVPFNVFTVYFVFFALIAGGWFFSRKQA